MTTEQKAKAYDKIRDRAKKELGACGSQDCDAARQMFRLFPELEESEDERIRKRIIHLVNKSHEQGGYALHKDEAEEMIAYLKKQAEHANFRNKIQIGDKVTRNRDGVLVNLSQLNRVAKKDEKQGEQKPNYNNKELKDVVIAELSKYNSNDLNAPWATDSTGLQYPLYFANLGAKWQSEQKPTDIDNKFIRMRETKPKDISEFLDRLTTVEQEFLWEHIAKIRELDKEEQKPTDKVEPKFKVGDWITFYGGKPFKILKVESEQNGILDYLLLSQNGHNSYYNKKYVDENARLWTIQDAKEGDVLFIGIDASTCIFKKLEGNLLYSYIISDGKLLVEDSHYYYEISDNISPATKEQRDLLFSKMKEAGYEWDAEKLELKKIEQKPIECLCVPSREIIMNVWELGNIWKELTGGNISTEHGTQLEYIQKHWTEGDYFDKIEQKPAWSEEDENVISLILSICNDFLENFKISPASTRIVKEDVDKIENWLKSLKDRVLPKQEWSEKDERHIDTITSLLEDRKKEQSDWGIEVLNEEIDWLKSLKDRVQPQNRWKPSVFHLECIEDAISLYEKRGINAVGLKEILEELKKLREE